MTLRFDKNPRLISYSYYIKFVIADDQTFFQHCDINIERFLIDDKSKNIIQNSISLNDEMIEKRCTKIVLDFHRRIVN